ncbi:hypothetical protein PHLGIDRAFT_123574 [Phlebiopsis gigantea 11061_1 CR5-6]|uniref:Uncharacterized protein n=1 Tax=Phlebiopsis gigantea (strain 11061_1 CR5-6) TaxID=745531 RepID=A0A0C3RYE8_PHLG1|nr:hypothetical protein PHLGIDRAFT_123574 [Phlebiopsis gigantea 11061_1 CR5-6]
MVRATVETTTDEDDFDGTDSVSWDMASVSDFSEDPFRSPSPSLSPPSSPARYMSTSHPRGQTGIHWADASTQTALFYSSAQAPPPKVPSTLRPEPRVLISPRPSRSMSTTPPTSPGQHPRTSSSPTPTSTSSTAGTMPAAHSTSRTSPDPVSPVAPQSMSPTQSFILPFTTQPTQPAFLRSPSTLPRMRPQNFIYIPGIPDLGSPRSSSHPVPEPVRPSNNGAPSTTSSDPGQAEGWQRAYVPFTPLEYYYNNTKSTRPSPPSTPRVDPRPLYNPDITSCPKDDDGVSPAITEQASRDCNDSMLGPGNRRSPPAIWKNLNC